MYDVDAMKKVRRDILTMSYHSKVGHIPSALSMVDYLGKAFEAGITPELYRFVLGKPFGAQAYYALFAHFGWIPSDFSKYGSLDTQWRYIIQKDHDLITYIDESMGNCLSVACGIALAGKSVFINISDAAFQEGTIWESLLFAGAHKLGKMVMTVDHNDMQALGRITDILDMGNLADKISSFGWKVFSCDGHDLASLSSILEGLTLAKMDCPVAFVFKTKKGKGISFMEESAEWHYKALDDEMYERALGELL